MNETSTNSFLKKESIRKLMGKYSIPCVISLLVAALYNIVDQILLPTRHIMALTEMLPIQRFSR